MIFDGALIHDSIHAELVAAYIRPPIRCERQPVLTVPWTVSVTVSEAQIPCL